MDPNSGKVKLINRLGREELQKRLENEKFKRTTVSFYKYVKLQNPTEVRDSLFEKWNNLDCLGRIYVAKEGINARNNFV